MGSLCTAKCEYDLSRVVPINRDEVGSEGQLLHSVLTDFAE